MNKLDSLRNREWEDKTEYTEDYLLMKIRFLTRENMNLKSKIRQCDRIVELLQKNVKILPYVDQFVK